MLITRKQSNGSAPASLPPTLPGYALRCSCSFDTDPREKFSILLTGSTLKIICASVDLDVVYVFVDWLLARDSKRIGPIFVCNA